MTEQKIKLPLMQYITNTHKRSCTSLQHLILPRVAASSSALLSLSLSSRHQPRTASLACFAAEARVAGWVGGEENQSSHARGRGKQLLSPTTHITSINPSHPQRVQKLYQDALPFHFLLVHSPGFEKALSNWNMLSPFFIP